MIPIEVFVTLMHALFSLTDFSLNIIINAKHPKAILLYEILAITNSTKERH